MEWLISSVLILIASTSTIAALAISAVILLVLAQALILLYRASAKPQAAHIADSQKSPHQS